jgi:hypothetical protein
VTPPSPDHTERSTLAVCIAHVAGASGAMSRLIRKSSERGLPSADSGSYPYRTRQRSAGRDRGSPGARRPARDGSGPRAVVMFGVPSGPIWDPAGTTDEILDGSVLAPAWPPLTAAEAGIDLVEALVLAPAAEAPVMLVDEAVAIVGRGLKGDRYADGTGTFASGRPGSALTLIDAAVLDTFGGDVDHRRNVVVRGTDLNALVGHEFTLGEARCRGRRLCGPCAHLDRLNGGGILRPLVHRGGLRADVIRGGTIRIGDQLKPD